MLKVICRDASGQFEDVGFKVQKDKDYEVLDYLEIDGIEYYLIYREPFFKYYYDVRRFDIVQQEEQLHQYLNSSFYETILNEK